MEAKTEIETEPKPRPLWLSDAKWIVGILAFFVVAATALVMSLGRLTERDTAVNISTMIIATMFSPGGLDDPGDIEQAKTKLKAVPGKSLEVLPGVTITADEVEGKSPRELRLMIFRRLAEPIYDQGTFSNSQADGNTPGVKPGNDTPGVEETAEFKTPSPTADTIGMLALLSNESHQKLLGIQRLLFGISSLLLLLLILSSTGFGRLASPGWVFVLVSAMPMIVLALLDLSIRSHPTVAPTGEPSLASQVALVGSSVAPMVVDAFQATYRTLLMTGAGLVLFATIVGPLWHLWQRHRSGASLPDHDKKA